MLADWLESHEAGSVDDGAQMLVLASRHDRRSVRKVAVIAEWWEGEVD